MFKKISLALLLGGLAAINANAAVVKPGTGSTHGIAYCITSRPCPDGYTGTIVYGNQFRYPSNVGSPQDYCAWNEPRGTPSWPVESNTCVPVAPAGPSFVENRTESQNLACPASAPNGTWVQSRTYEFWSDGSARNHSGWVNTVYTCSAAIQSYQSENRNLNCPATTPSGTWTQRRTYEIWSDGSARNYSDWTNVVYTCSATGSTVTQYQDLACPSTSPSGVWKQSRTYTQWSDGRTTDFSAWKNVSYTCQAVKQRTETQYRNLACEAPQTGVIQQKRTYDVWTDGSTKNYSAWTVSSNTCTSPNINLNDNRTEPCPVGYTGKKVYEWVLAYKNTSYTVKDADKNDVTYTISVPYQTERLKSDSCVLIPTQNTSSSKTTEEISCDSYYNVSPGTYTGSVYRYGTKTTTYNSGTKQTTTTFDVDSVDATSCKLGVTDMTLVKKTGPCPTGTSGTIEYYKYKAVNSAGKEVYISDDWIVASNNCVSNSASNNNSSNNGEVASPDGLLSGLSLTSSRIQKNDELYNYLNTLSSSQFNANETKKLVIEVDNLSDYNATKIEKVITKFNSIVGQQNADVEIVIPKTIDKYIGLGGITASNIKSKSLAITDIKVVKNQAVVSYTDFSQNMKSASNKKEIKINLLNSTKLSNVTIH